MIPYGKQSISEADIAAVVAALRSDYLTTGPEVDAFELEFANVVGAQHAVAVNSGTAALHLAMLVAGVGSGDRVLTSPNTFLATANAAAMVGAIPDFVDIAPESGNLCPVALEAAWKPDVKAVIAVDYAGRPADMPGIAAIARKHGAIVIEDACHALGSRFQWEGEAFRIGGHPWADITTFSFHPVKTITSGEGGMLVTNNQDYASHARILRSHGMERDPRKMNRFGKCPDRAYHPWVYEMQQLSNNYRLSDIHAALGRSQLKQLPHFIERRGNIVARYNAAFQQSASLSPLAAQDEGHGRFRATSADAAWHLYPVLIDLDHAPLSRAELVARLAGKGIGTQVHYIPVYLQDWYAEQFGYAAGKCPNAESFYARVLSLPLYPGLSDSDVDYIIETVEGLMNV